eukprot:jgi/Mesvir1/197/Mv13546-RA.1
MAPSFQFKCVALNRNSGEYKALSDHVKKFGLDVTAVTRVQNPKMWKQYYEQRVKMQKAREKPRKITADLPPYNVHESLLFHCSSRDGHAKVYEDGLDLPLPTGRGTFGTGIYLTDDPRRVEARDNYTGKLYVCAALLGDVLAVPARSDFAPWQTAPEKAIEERRTPADTHFDSVVGRRALDAYGNTGPNEFVLYRQSAICPMYIVEFAGARISKSYPSPQAYRGVPDFARRSKGARGPTVPNPFGTVAGSSNYVDDNSCWDCFLHNFYHAASPPVAAVPAAHVGNAGRSPTPAPAEATPVRMTSQPAAPTSMAAAIPSVAWQQATTSPASAAPAFNPSQAGTPGPSAPAASAGNVKQANVSAHAPTAAANTASPGSREELCVSAAPTERPPANASAPPMWWGDDSERPHTWTATDNSQPFACVALESDSAEYRMWAAQMMLSGLQVKAVTRIQNPRLWDRYVLYRHHMLQDNVLIPGARPDLPALLYHCSKEPDHTQICGQGLDLRLAKEGTFGAGNYLTDDPRKAIDYSGNTGKIYVFAAILGDVLAVPARDKFAEWKREPKKIDQDQRSKADKHFNSLVGRRAFPSAGTTGANEFVLYEASATCPMYMVEFAMTANKRVTPTPSALRGVPDFAWKSMGAKGANVPNPFGDVAGTSSYVDDGTRWNFFLHTFYKGVVPDVVRPEWTIAIGMNVMAEAANAANATTVCKGCKVTEKVLAKYPGWKCVICQSLLVQGVCLVMPCGHVNGHTDCCRPLIQTRVMADRVTSQTFTRCEVCTRRFGVTVGKQPLNAHMTHQVVPGITLAGHAQGGAIKITYIIPDGRQDPDGDDPGKPFAGTRRDAYLPNSTEGNEVLKQLQQAFQQRLIFSVGTSQTTGRDNVVIWNGIHHKTDLTPHAEHGYPDGTYLTRVKAEMQQAGVVV